MFPIARGNDFHPHSNELFCVRFFFYLARCRMQWQGQADNLIDRFDVRAHLDYIPPVQKSKEPEELSVEERQCNYESYRILAQNEFLGETTIF